MNIMKTVAMGIVKAVVKFADEIQLEEAIHEAAMDLLKDKITPDEIQNEIKDFIKLIKEKI